MKHNYRWTICGALFFATTINYEDVVFYAMNAWNISVYLKKPYFHKPCP
jgi:hypothetical protein